MRQGDGDQEKGSKALQKSWSKLDMVMLRWTRVQVAGILEVMEMMRKFWEWCGNFQGILNARKRAGEEHGRIWEGKSESTKKEWRAQVGSKGHKEGMKGTGWEYD